MKRVLLTGASGFIGSHCIAPLIERGYEVHAVSSDASTEVPTESLDSVQWHRADLLDTSAARALLADVEPTHLLHLAWYVVPGNLISAPENFAWVRASLELVQEFEARGGKRLTVCGSGYEYDWAYGYCTEGLTPAVPDTVYGACKQSLNRLVESYSELVGLSAAWGRVFFVYGPREHARRLVSSVILSLIRGEPARCSHGRQIRDYMHVQDVANGLVQLLDSEVTGSVNVSSGQATTLREIVLKIGELRNHPELIELGALPARTNDVPLVVGNNARLLGEVGWTQQLDLEAGLRQTIEWWEDHGGARA